MSARKRNCSFLVSSAKIGIFAMRPVEDKRLFIFANMKEAGLMVDEFKTFVLLGSGGGG